MKEKILPCQIAKGRSVNFARYQYRLNQVKYPRLSGYTKVPWHFDTSPPHAISGNSPSSARIGGDQRPLETKGNATQTPNNASGIPWCVLCCLQIYLRNYCIIEKAWNCREGVGRKITSSTAQVCGWYILTSDCIEFAESWAILWRIIFFLSPFAAAASTRSCIYHVRLKSLNRNAASSTVMLQVISLLAGHFGRKSENKMNRHFKQGRTYNSVKHKSYYFPKCIGNGTTFILRENNAPVMVIHANLAI